MNIPFSLKGRTALIAGASSGFGARFAKLFAAAGANDEASIIAAYDAAEAKFGTVDSIVANAGVAATGRSTEVPADRLQMVLDTNFKGVYLVAREGAKRLIASGSREKENGRIVIIGSITSRLTGEGDSARMGTDGGECEHPSSRLYSDGNPGRLV
jgi:NAD(P)-dependent dehydrogenase (short-subunit alcohol dehydrogenase family)